MSFVTFIIPTIGRPTLDRTIKWLEVQTDPDWNAIIVADRVDNFSLPVESDKCLYVNLSKKLGTSNFSAMVRNHGMSFANGEWIAFVDDDDRIGECYVQWLKEECASYDLVIFRMATPDGICIPPAQDIGPGLVGISFAVRSSFQREKGILFSPSGGEDWDFVEKARGSKARIKISDHIAYYVRH